MQMTCTECGKVGNEDDLCELGEPCPDAHEGCGGVMVTWQPIPLGVTRHPVDELPQVEFDAAAARALTSLREKDHAFVDLSPGDATRYRIALVGEEEPHRLWVASNFGVLAILPDTRLHWDYVSSHMLEREHEWTARVITRFLNTLRYLRENHHGDMED